MRIKNVGKCLIIFNGGSLPVGKVADFKGSAEKIGASLLKAYPSRLLNLDETKEEDIVSIEVVPEVKEEVKAEAKAEVKATPKVKKITKRKK
jgi:hypothetical protein